MAGTREGGIKARNKNLAKDPDFYKKIGVAGGRKSKGGGFAYGEIGREKARLAGSKGGKISRRKSTSNKPWSIRNGKI